jgi:hypothetical protein
METSSLFLAVPMYPQNIWDCQTKRKGSFSTVINVPHPSDLKIATGQNQMKQLGLIIKNEIQMVQMPFYISI